MYLSEPIDFEKVLAIVDENLKPTYLTKVQELVLQHSWEGKTYSEIASSYNYDSEYIKGVGYQLWQLLSDTFREPINKSNFQQFIRRYIASLPNGQAPLIEQASHRLKRQDWGTSPDVSTFRGRTEELAQLTEWVNHQHCRLGIVIGLVGSGKTALASRFAQQVSEQFDYVIWRSLRNSPPVEETLDTLIRFFSDEQIIHLPDTLDNKILQLLHYFRQHRCLLVLDDLQSILGNSSRADCYRVGYEGYGQFFRLFVNTWHQSFLLLTSWNKPKSLSFYEGTKVRSLGLRGLHTDTLREIFQDQIQAWNSEEEWEILLERYGGNPQLLTIATSMIQKFFNGQINQFLRQNPIIFDDIRILLDRQFDRLSALEKELVYWLAIHNLPMPLEKLATNVVQPASRIELLEALISLEQESLIESEDACYTVQPLIKDYLISKLIKTIFEDKMLGNSSIAQ